MKSIKLFLVFSLFLTASAQLLACEESVISISSCLGNTTTWNTSDSNDYAAVKEICAGEALQFDVRCSKGSLLNPSDEICIYEVDANGNLFLVYCSAYGDLDFVPEPGKTYKLTVNGDDFKIQFTTVDCMPEIIATQNGQSDCLEEGSPIEFSLEGNSLDPNCYYLEWNFGDCTDIETTDAGSGAVLEHTFEFPMNPNSWCKTFTVTVTAVSFCPGCEDVEFTKTITVCQMCSAQEWGGDVDIDVNVHPNPTPGLVDGEIYYEGGETLQYMIISQLWDGTVIHVQDFPQVMEFPYFFNYDFSPYVSGNYNITITSQNSVLGGVTIQKQ